MNMNKAAVTIGLTAAGVIVAGLVLYYGKSVKILNDAHQGFDYVG